MQRILPVFTGFFLLGIPALFGFGKNFNANVACDENTAWRNHGTYVSCVAHTQTGGVAISAAARSDIGKKNNSSQASPSPQVSPSPSPSPSVSPEPSPSPSPEASPTALTISTRASVSANVFLNLIRRFENFLDRFF